MTNSPTVSCGLCIEKSRNSPWNTPPVCRTDRKGNFSWRSQPELKFQKVPLWDRLHGHLGPNMQGDLCGAPHQKIDNSSLDVSKETLYFKFSWKLFFFFFLCAIQEHNHCGLFLSTTYEHKHHGKILHSAFKTWFEVFLSFQTRTTRAIGSRELSTKFWGG